MEKDKKTSLCQALMRKLCSRKGDNFVFSPLSLEIAFSMLVAGVDGPTKEELLNFLGVNEEIELHLRFGSLQSSKCFQIANKYLVPCDYEVLPEFDKILKEEYDCEVEAVDFVKDSSTIVRNVNSWVSSKTNAMIKELLAPGSVDRNTVLILLNAVYFKGTWCKKFELLPELEDFRLRDGTNLKKTFMSVKSKKIRYHENDSLKMVKIPYVEDGFSMVLAVPKNEGEHIDEIMCQMTQEESEENLRQLDSSGGYEVFLKMPKFKIDFSYENVIEHMKELGVQKIFDGSQGDFSRIFKNDSNRKYCVSDVVHKAVITVDEIGTEAAAATGIIMMRCCMIVETRNIHLEVKEPFYFAIQLPDRSIAFQGVCFCP